jgi:hypothetical protein
MKTEVDRPDGSGDVIIEYYWHITARNGRIIARSSETYSRKSGAVKSIKTAAQIFRYDHPASYYDHSKPDLPIQSYL